MQADVETTLIYQVGLRLPDGTEVFPPEVWHGRALDTNEDRKVILDALIASAGNLGIAPEELLGRYAWVVREFEKIVAIVPTNSSERRLDDEELTRVNSVVETPITDKTLAVETEEPAPPAPIFVEDSDLNMTLPPSA